MSEIHANKYRGENPRGSTAGASICSTKSLSDDVLVIQKAEIISAKIRKELGVFIY